MDLSLIKNSVMNKTFNRGFTLIELMVTIAILGILVAIALPNMSSFIINSQKRAVVGDFVSSVALARSEAIKRGQPVVIRSAGTGANSFQNGWTMFVDANNDAIEPAANPIIIERRETYRIDQIRVGCGSMARAGGREYVRFNARGQTEGVNGQAAPGRVAFQILRNSNVVSIAEMTLAWGGRTTVNNNVTTTSC
jgi:prepilin-type N-terminal cleavage/methylation domain-containing protein